MNIKDNGDASFDITLSSGRVIMGMYARRIEEKEPCALSLSTIIQDVKGNPFALITEYEVNGQLERQELYQLCKKLDNRAKKQERTGNQ